jgi:ubiquitin carboxyl-terminal hydrolase 35/38
LTPEDVLKAARPPDFFPGHQQDSSEFLGHLLEKLHEQEKRNLSSSPLKIGKWGTHADLASNTIADESPKIEVKTADLSATNSTAVTLIQKTFAGQISISYQCKECGAKSSHVDSFRDLQLSFPDCDVSAVNKDEVVGASGGEGDTKKVYSVQNLLDFYCSSEKLIGDNQYFCDKCQKLCDGERSITVVEAPKSLILTLKHFRYDQRYHTRAKLMQKVIHDETIALPVDVTSTNVEKVTYCLYAAVIHSGMSMDCGHYYTYATDGKWFKFNDNYVTESSINELHNLSPPNTPYILFYQMMTPHPTAKAEEQKEMDITNGNFESENSLDLEQLPSHLRDLINKDNSTFKEEIQRQKQKPQFVQSWPVLGKKNFRDSDDDPPPNCGGKAIDCHNRYIC